MGSLSEQDTLSVLQVTGSSLNRITVKEKDYEKKIRCFADIVGVDCEQRHCTGICIELV